MEDAMAKDATKQDLREGLPGHGDADYSADVLNRSDDKRVATEPQIVTPEIGKNVPSGQTTKG
jgi:hypothetical protein